VIHSVERSREVEQDECSSVYQSDVNKVNSESGTSTV